MGVIGNGNQGSGDMKSFLTDERVQVVAICDLNKESPGSWDGDIAGREPLTGGPTAGSEGHSAGSWPEAKKARRGTTGQAQARRIDFSSLAALGAITKPKQ